MITKIINLSLAIKTKIELLHLFYKNISELLLLYYRIFYIIITFSMKKTFIYLECIPVRITMLTIIIVIKAKSPVILSSNFC